MINSIKGMFIKRLVLMATILVVPLATYAGEQCPCDFSVKEVTDAIASESVAIRDQFCIVEYKYSIADTKLLKQAHVGSAGSDHYVEIEVLNDEDSNRNRCVVYIVDASGNEVRSEQVNDLNDEQYNACLRNILHLSAKLDMPCSP